MTRVLCICICTYNGASRIPRLFARLRGQRGIDPDAWEVIVVDNASTDDVAGVTRHCLSGWEVPWRVVREERQGLVFAREAGLLAASAEWVAFLDDDNLPAEDWAARALDCAERVPRLGAFGGLVVPLWEAPPPPGIQRIVHMLGCSCSNAMTREHRYEPVSGVLPPGSGLVVRRSAWLSCVPEANKLFFRGRFPGSPLGGEELECLRHLQRGTWEVWHFPQLRLDHLIPAGRLEPDRLRALCRAAGLVRHHLRRVRWPPPQRWIALPACFFLDLVRWLAAQAKRLWSPDTEPLVTSCERAFLWGTLISPFYLLYWTRAMRDRALRKGAPAA